MTVTDKRGCFGVSSNNRYRGWDCPECGKWHLPFHTKCGRYRRCIECDAETLDFARDRCLACYQRLRRREKQKTRPMILCTSCNGHFRPKRSDARYCSGRCRQQAYRGRLMTTTDSDATVSETFDAASQVVASALGHEHESR